MSEEKARLVQLRDENDLPIVPRVASQGVVMSDGSTLETYIAEHGGVGKPSAITSDGEVYIAVVDSEGILRYAPAAILNIGGGTTSFNGTAAAVSHSLMIGDIVYNGSESKSVPIYNGELKEV